MRGSQGGPLLALDRSYSIEFRPSFRRAFWTTVSPPRQNRAVNNEWAGVCGEESGDGAMGLCDCDHADDGKPGPDRRPASAVSSTGSLDRARAAVIWTGVKIVVRLGEDPDVGVRLAQPTEPERVLRVAGGVLDIPSTDPHFRHVRRFWSSTPAVSTGACTGLRRGSKGVHRVPRGDLVPPLDMADHASHLVQGHIDRAA